MDKDVIISVRGNQASLGTEQNEIELITEGKYYKRENAYYVIYTESEMTGLEDTVTTLEITEDKVILSRTGRTNSQLIFEQGHKHVSYYDTVKGAFTVGVYTNRVNVAMRENGGEISIGYSLEVDNNVMEESDFHVLIRETNPSVNEILINN